MASSRWITTKFPGVRYRKHPTRKHGVNFDQYFAIGFYPKITDTSKKFYNEASKDCLYRKEESSSLNSTLLENQ